jgi:hypothetical protein
MFPQNEFFSLLKRWMKAASKGVLELAPTSMKNLADSTMFIIECCLSLLQLTNVTDLILKLNMLSEYCRIGPINQY